MALENPSFSALAARFQELFRYSDGQLYWRSSIGSAKAGSRAGFQKPNGTKTKKFYEFIQVDGKTYPTHRIVYAMFTGELPEIIDHIDQDTLNNRIENLRPASQSENLCNRGKNVTNTSGYKGVYFEKSKNKWRAEIAKDGKKHRLGLFESAADAADAYQRAAKKLHGEFAFLPDQPAESEISPAAADRATSLALNSGEAAAVAPPKPERSPAAAGADDKDHWFGLFPGHVENIRINAPDDDTDEHAFPRARRIVCSASSDGQFTIHRPGSVGITLTAHEARTVFEFLEDAQPIFERIAK